MVSCTLQDNRNLMWLSDNAKLLHNMNRSCRAGCEANVHMAAAFATVKASIQRQEGDCGPQWTPQSTYNIQGSNVQQYYSP